VFRRCVPPPFTVLYVVLLGPIGSPEPRRSCRAARGREQRRADFGVVTVNMMFLSVNMLY
jgi:hypothetical protein